MFGFGKKKAPAKEQTIAEEAGLPDNWVPVEAPVVRPGIETNGPHQYPSGTLPQLLGLQPDLVDTKYGGGIPSVRLMPIASTAATNAAVAATVKSIIQTTPAAPSSSGSGSPVSLVMPQEFVVAGSPGSALVVTKATEPANTAWAAPGLGLSGLEAIVAGAVGPSTAGGVGISVTAAPTTATSWGLFAYYTNAGASPVPAGWASITGSDPIFTKSLTGFSPVTVSETVPALNNGGLSTLAIFAGAMPSIVQNTSDGFSYLGAQTKAFPSSNTAGNTLIIVMYSQGDTSGTAPSLSASDSNGNTYTALSNLAYGGTITNVHSNNQGLSQQILIAVNCASGANTVTWNVGGQTGGGRSAALYMYEIGPLAPGPGLPFFRQLSGADFSGFDASKIIGGLVPTTHGGTGADLSGTGGTSQVLKQNSAGANITVGTLSAANLSNGTLGSGNIVLASAGTTKSNPVDSTANAANIGSTTLFSAPASGLYRISYYLIVSRAATTSSTLPNLKITWTDQDNATVQTASFVASAPSGNTLTTVFSGAVTISYSVGTVVSYQTGDSTAYASVGGTSMQYAVHIRVEAL